MSQNEQEVQSFDRELALSCGYSLLFTFLDVFLRFWGVFGEFFFVFGEFFLRFWDVLGGVWGVYFLFF